jgi:hypothetical protein
MSECSVRPYAKSRTGRIGINAQERDVVKIATRDICDTETRFARVMELQNDFKRFDIRFKSVVN